MLRAHFERLRPLCPACRSAGRPPARLVLGEVANEEDDDIREGVLVCSEPLCRCEHPIIDGIPVVVSDIGSWASHQLASVLRRDDLSAFTEGLLGDAAGPGSEFERERINLGIYGWSHWGDLAGGDARAQAGGAYAELLGQALPLAGQPFSGCWVDLGCAVGRGSFEAARCGAELVVGVDLNFSMLRMAERLRRSGRAVFPLRRVGIVHDRFDHPAPGLPSERVSFWCCDVGVLPFGDAAFDGALMLNLLDCVPSPLALLCEAGRVLAEGAPALFSSPYDWSAQATPPVQWFGGHSQRGPAGGASAPELRRILSPDRAAGVDTGLVIETEHDGLPWRLRTSERSMMRYAVHLALLRRSRRPAAGPGATVSAAMP